MLVWCTISFGSTLTWGVNICVSFWGGVLGRKFRLASVASVNSAADGYMTTRQGPLASSSRGAWPLSAVICLPRWNPTWALALSVVLFGRRTGDYDSSLLRGRSLGTNRRLAGLVLVAYSWCHRLLTSCSHCRLAALWALSVSWLLIIFKLSVMIKPQLRKVFIGAGRMTERGDFLSFLCFKISSENEVACRLKQSFLMCIMGE